MKAGFSLQRLADAIANPSDLWLVADLADLRDDAGRLDAEKVKAKVAEVVKGTASVAPAHGRLRWRRPHALRAAALARVVGPTQAGADMNNASNPLPPFLAPGWPHAAVVAPDRPP